MPSWHELNIHALQISLEYSHSKRVPMDHYNAVDKKSWIATCGFLKTLSPLALHSDRYVMCLANLSSHHHSCLFSHFWNLSGILLSHFTINIHLYQLEVNFEKCNTFHHEKPNHSTNLFTGPNSQCHCYHTSVDPMSLLTTRMLSLTLPYALASTKKWNTQWTQ
jgi:hypothetical protein